MTITNILVACAVIAGANDEPKQESQLERFNNVVYVKRGDTNLLADVYVPHGDGPFPSVLMVHGGAWRTGAKWHMGGHARRISECGYTVVNINYRLAPKHKFPAQIDDCRAALLWMRKNAEDYKIDPKRIAGYGYSAGAHLVSLLGVTNPRDDEGTRLRAVVAGGTPCDFQDVRPNATIFKYWLGGTRNELPDVYKQASPVTFVTADDPPFFFFHGEKDLLVPRRTPDRMMNLLKEINVRAEWHEVPEKGHITAMLDKTAQEKAIAFLNDVLKSK